MRHGVPFHEAFGLAPGENWQLDGIERAAMAITFGIFEGGKFNWSTMEFEERK